MTPITLNAVQKFSDKMLSGNALQLSLSAAATSEAIILPMIDPSQVVISSASSELADKNLQLTYPRICVSAITTQNTQIEKFRSFSGSVTLNAEIFASGSFLGDVEQWIHFYVEGVASILRSNVGDWGDGMFYGGAYDVQFQTPKSGGFGYVQSAKLMFALHVSVS